MRSILRAVCFSHAQASPGSLPGYDVTGSAGCSDRPPTTVHKSKRCNHSGYFSKTTSKNVLHRKYTKPPAFKVFGSLHLPSSLVNKDWFLHRAAAAGHPRQPEEEAASFVVGYRDVGVCRQPHVSTAVAARHCQTARCTAE